MTAALSNPGTAAVQPVANTQKDNLEKALILLAAAHKCLKQPEDVIEFLTVRQIVELLECKDADVD